MSTPRTNDAEYFCTCTMQGDAFVPSNAVPADFARQIERDLAAATARVARLEEALRFYATEGNWQNDLAECHGAPVAVPWTAEVYSDNGNIARAALGEKGGRR